MRHTTESKFSLGFVLRRKQQKTLVTLIGLNRIQTAGILPPFLRTIRRNCGRNLAEREYCTVHDMWRVRHRYRGYQIGTCIITCWHLGVQGRGVQSSSFSYCTVLYWTSRFLRPSLCFLRPRTDLHSTWWGTAS